MADTGLWALQLGVVYVPGWQNVPAPLHRQLRSCPHYKLVKRIATVGKAVLGATKQTGSVSANHNRTT